MSVGGNPFQGQWNPTQGSYPSQGICQGKPLPESVQPNARGFPFTRDVEQGETLLFLMETRWVEVFLLLTRDFKVSIKTLWPSKALPGNLVPVTIQGILFWLLINPEKPTPLIGILGQQRLPFLEMLNFPDLLKLMNDLVCHDPNWPLGPH
jgi:hypothetical protein